MSESVNEPRPEVTARSWEPVLDCFDRERIRADTDIPGGISIGSFVRIEPFGEQLARRAQRLPDDPINLFESGHTSERLQ